MDIQDVQDYYLVIFAKVEPPSIALVWFGCAGSLRAHETLHFVDGASGALLEPLRMASRYSSMMFYGNDI